MKFGANYFFSFSQIFFLSGAKLYLAHFEMSDKLNSLNRPCPITTRYINFGYITSR